MNWDFVVAGIPVSVNSSNTKKKGEWIKQVRSHALAAIPREQRPTFKEVQVGIIYFHDGPTDLDIDNIIKRILDGLWPEILDDDSQVQDVSSSRRDTSGDQRWIDPPPTILPYLFSGIPFVYVTISDAMPQEEIPWIAKRPQ